VPVTILVADDSASMRKILEMTFQGEDAKVHAVPSGDAAVARAQEVRPDIVFADASMSGMDGYELSRALKSNPSLNGTAVIVMASQQAPFDAERGRACGVDDHVVKPFDTQQVIDRVTQVLTRPRATVAGGASAAPRVPPPPPPPTAVAAQRPAPPPPPAPPSAGPQQGAKPSPMRSTVAFGAQPVAAPPQPTPNPAPAAPRPQAPQGTAAGGMGAPPARQPAARPVLELADDMSAPAAPTPARAPAPAAPAPAAAPARPAAAVAAATSGDGDMARRLGDLGLSQDQVAGVLALSREVIERVVWEVVPDLAEAIIREELKRLTSE
jgi:CheY-like chemotaxis protein